MLKYKIEVSLIKGARLFLGIFPIKWRFKSAEFLGILTYYLIKKRRNITYKNLNIAFPEKSAEELKKIAKASYKNSAKNVIIPMFLNDLIKKNWIEIENVELADVANSKGKGFILTTIHLGGVEAGFSMTDRYDVYAVFKKQKNPYLNDLMSEYREQAGAHTILKNIENDSNAKIAEVFKKKGLLVLLSDHFSDDTEITFFGRKTKANVGNLLLGIKYDVPVIFGYSVFEDGKIKLRFVNEVVIEKKGKLRETLQYNTQKLFYEYEKVISKYPEQYMWQHNRWRD